MDMYTMLEFPNLLYIGLGLSALAILKLTLLSFLTPWIRRTRSELMRTEVVYNPEVQTQEAFPCLLKKAVNERPAYTPSDLYLSIVVPAMNEEERLPVMLDECLEYCEKRRADDKKFSYEVVVVDDGSRDSTAEIGFSYGKKFGGRVKVMKLDGNRGKGGAVRLGVLHCRGQLILFVDADGATLFSDIKKLEQQMIRSCGGGEVDESFPGVVVGSRAHLEAESKATRSLPRTILMHGFHLLVWIFTVRTVRDTQCGFKLFTRAAATRLFTVLHIERWAFDVELLYLAEQWKMSISEVSVTWHEVDGSKVTPIWSWLQMGRDLVLIWFRYKMGIWTDEVVA